MTDVAVVNGIRRREVGLQDSNPRAGAKAGAIKHNRKCMQNGSGVARCWRVRAAGEVVSSFVVLCSLFSFLLLFLRGAPRFQNTTQLVCTRRNAFYAAPYTPSLAQASPSGQAHDQRPAARTGEVHNRRCVGRVLCYCIYNILGECVWCGEQYTVVAEIMPPVLRARL